MAIFYVRLCIVSPYCCKPDVQLVNMLRGTGFRFFQIGFCIVVKLSLKSFFYSERPEFCIFLLIRDYQLYINSPIHLSSNVIKDTNTNAMSTLWEQYFPSLFSLILHIFTRLSHVPEGESVHSFSRYVTGWMPFVSTSQQHHSTETDKT